MGDICARCYQTQLANSYASEPSMYHSPALANKAGPSNVCPGDARSVFESMLTSALIDSEALRTLWTLVQDHGLKFSVDDARRVALSTSSPEMLQLVLCSAPQVQLLGMEIFDRRYPRLVLTEQVKACLKILLARGAHLGKKFVPPSKLLRKLEADANDAWERRYLIS